ncbi:MAG: hypothetical protein HFJ99_05155 [Eubacterium sp.]|jgi:uncharacterized protein YaaQ|nr:hypothetical protein [Eubacterium sp.]
MKLIITIISNKDIQKVLEALSKAGFFATKISTTGQFLEGGHSCIFIGVEQEKINEVFEVLGKNVTKRIIRQHGVNSTVAGTLLKQPVDVEEYGGVAFVIDVEDFRKF